MRSKLVLLIFCATVNVAEARNQDFKTEANVMVELTFAAKRVYPDPFNDVSLDVVFASLGGEEMRVPAFWAGEKVWKARFASPTTGIYRFKTVCSEPKDPGLHGVTGRVDVKAYEGKNPLFIHGPLRVSLSRTYLEHADGTPFFWLGDTWWMGLCNRMHWPEDFQTLAADRKEKGFNVIQIVAGLYPDMLPFDPRGANEAGFPWETNYNSICPEYFNAADRRILYLVEQGFVPCIFGAWGHYISGMGIEKMKQHWRYLIARYGALPVVWCAAGEANLPWYQVKDFPYDDRQQAKAWTEVMRYIRNVDPFHRVLTVHPTGLHRLSSRNVTDNPGLLDLDLLQTPHGTRGIVPDTVRNVRESYADFPVLPVINAEASYEMLVTPKDVIPTEWTRRMFWLCVMNGAAGHTYGANGIWQCNRKGQPHGASPNAGSPAAGYGTIPWDEAMNLPGSTQVGLGKKFFERFPWQHFSPHPEWAEFVHKTAVGLNGAQWIWFPEGFPATNAPAEKRFFRRVFVLPETKPIASARMRMCGDDQFEARLNGRLIGGAANFKFGRQFNELEQHLKPGTNIITVIAENKPAPGPDPAGLIARMEVRFEGGGELALTTDEQWRCAMNGILGWNDAAFDEVGWTNAIGIGKAGDPPWGKLDSLPSDGPFAPQCLGIRDGVRIIYVPQPDSIILRDLETDAVYRASYFDPVSGEESPMKAIAGDKKGRCLCAPPSGTEHDWVLVLTLDRGVAGAR